MKEFQEDLRNGMTLEDALKKYGLTFGEAVHRCNRLTSPVGTRHQKYHHIYKAPQGNYKVQRDIRKKRYTVMVDDLDTAVIIRDYLINVKDCMERLMLPAPRRRLTDNDGAYLPIISIDTGGMQ